MTEDQIERIAERKMDRLDRQFMAGEMSQVDYDKAVKDLDQWVKTELAKDPSLYSVKRYQVRTMTHKASPDMTHKVIDTWTDATMGLYSSIQGAQARARTLNSRNGGK